VKGKIFLFLAIILAIVAGLSRFYPFDKTPPEVTLEPRPGTYNEEISVALSSEKGATIYINLGDEDELPYVGPVRIRRNTVISYFAVDRWDNRSDKGAAEYVVRLDTEPPVTTARPRPGKYNHPVSVRLKSDEEAVIRYTTDGNEPDSRSTPYKGAITLRKDTLLKYYAVDTAGNIEEIKTAKYSITIDTAKPVTLVDPAGGLYKSAVTVSLAGERGSKIYYSLDGSRPSRRSPLYIEPITFTRSGVLRFFAVDDAGNMEKVREERYIIDRDPPRVSSKPSPGTYGKGVTVTLASSERGKIRYELGGQEPTMSSLVYTAPIRVNESTTVAFFGLDRAENRSKTVRAKYVIDRIPPTIVARPPGGSYSGRIRVKLESSEPATIHYTLDGSTPTTNSPGYRGPISVARNLELSYFAFDSVNNVSLVNKQKYILDSTPPVSAAEPAGGTYSGPIEIGLKTEKGAVIHYTVDGTTPIEASPEYSGAIRVSRDMVLKFYATDESGNREEIRVERYTFDSTPPSTVITPPPGAYNRPVSISMSSEKEGKIFLRLDGRKDFSPYRSPFVMDRSTRIFFYSEDSSGNREGVQMAEYIIDTQPPRTIPYPAPGEYNPPITLELKSEEGAKIHYTLDGSEPSVSSPVYLNPLASRDNVTVRFFAVDKAGNKEKAHTAIYRVASGMWRDYSNGVFLHPSVIDGDFLWVGGEEGLFRVNILTKRRKNFTTSHGMLSNSVRAMAVGRLGFKWIGTDRGVSQFDGKKNWVSYDYGDGLPSNIINCIVIDQKDNIWFGTDRGLSRYNGESFRNFTTRDGLPDNNVTSLAIDSDGVFWIGTQSGLVRFHQKVDKIYTVKDGLPSNRVTAVAVDGRWNVWVGTVDSGAARFDGSNWVPMGQSQGLGGRSVFTIGVDLSDNKWFGTDAGVFKYDGKSFELVKMPVYR